MNKSLTSDPSGQIVSEILALRNHSQKKKSEEENNMEFKAICQFRELFDVASVQSLVPKINELYVFCVEVKQGNLVYKSNIHIFRSFQVEGSHEMR